MEIAVEINCAPKSIVCIKACGNGLKQLAEKRPESEPFSASSCAKATADKKAMVDKKEEIERRSKVKKYKRNVFVAKAASVLLSLGLIVCLFIRMLI